MPVSWDEVTTLIAEEIRRAADTHGNASMAEGYLEDDCTVECPIHSARFCLKTGEALTQPANEDLATFDVVVEDDEIYVLVPEGAAA